MLKRNLEAEIRSGREQHDLLLARLPDMTDAEAEQWYRLLQSVKEDSERNGRRAGAREPWKR